MIPFLDGCAFGAIFGIAIPQQISTSNPHATFLWEVFIALFALLLKAMLELGILIGMWIRGGFDVFEVIEGGILQHPELTKTITLLTFFGLG